MKRFASLALAVALSSSAVSPSVAESGAVSFADVISLADSAFADVISLADSAKEHESRARYLKEVASQISKLGEQMLSVGYDSTASAAIAGSLDAFMRAKEGGHTNDIKKWADAVRLRLGLRIEPFPDEGPWFSEVWVRIEGGKERVCKLSSLPYYQEYLSTVVIPQMATQDDAK